jgi:hypothetical protein
VARLVTACWLWWSASGRSGAASGHHRHASGNHLSETRAQSTVGDRRMTLNRSDMWQLSGDQMLVACVRSI